MTVWQLILLVICASLISFGINSAPEAVIKSTWKPILIWIILVIVILIILTQVFSGGSNILNYRIGR